MASVRGGHVAGGAVCGDSARLYGHPGPAKTRKPARATLRVLPSVDMRTVAASWRLGKGCRRAGRRT
jgi:hypothetical protein